MVRHHFEDKNHQKDQPILHILLREQELQFVEVLVHCCKLYYQGYCWGLRTVVKSSLHSMSSLLRLHLNNVDVDVDVDVYDSDSSSSK